MENNMHHVMIDCETLGLTPGSVIRNLSAVEFNPNTGDIIRKKTWIINLQDSITNGFRVEAGTLKWWMMKDEAARNAFVAKDQEEMSLNSFINDFIFWMESYHGNITIWGLQLDFDLPMIKCYLSYYFHKIYRQDQYKIPWNRKNIVEVRPFMNAYMKAIEKKTIK